MIEVALTKPISPTTLEDIQAEGPFTGMLLL
ncbi:hypothetical protein XFLM_04115 [Xylella fastidiosa subsp. fastidiosa GB514]|nr:hypothetical protein XFLM_04115 [Xylella fastidiosa subsp. fastidiosa GB514]